MSRIFALVTYIVVLFCVVLVYYLQLFMFGGLVMVWCENRPIEQGWDWGFFLLGETRDF